MRQELTPSDVCVETHLPGKAPLILSAVLILTPGTIPGTSTWPIQSTHEFSYQVL